MLCAAGASAVRADNPAFSLTIKDHAFSPADFEVPANAKVKLIVKNADPTPEEFESAKLHRERVIPGGQEATITIGPLKSGRYEYVGDFHRATAHGTITAK
jgi:hypothetical protein